MICPPKNRCELRIILQDFFLPIDRQRRQYVVEKFFHDEEFLAYHRQSSKDAEIQEHSMLHSA